VDYRDIVKPETYTDERYLNSLMQHMRQHDAVPFIETEDYKPFWIATRHADILEIERQHTTFVNTFKSVLENRETEAKLDETGPWLRTLIHMDDPEHALFRGLTRDWFLPGNLSKFDSRIRAIATATVDQMLALGGEMDFVKDVAVWYPLRIIMMILGIPESDESYMLRLTQELLGDADPDVSRASSSPDDRMALIAEFFDYFRAIIADRKVNPSDDVASTIAHGLIDGEPLNEMDVISYYVIIATAGHDTTSSAIAGGVRALIDNPEQLELLLQASEQTPLVVDEAIRWTSPVKHFLRYATEDYELRGRNIKAGDAIMLLYPSGNRDEEVFDEPFAFKSDRRPNRHLAFGHGVHHCLGNLLAKMEMVYLYDEIFRRVRSIELNGEPRIMASNFVTGLKSLPIRVKAK